MLPAASLQCTASSQRVACYFLGSALRLYGLDRQSAWADEITTLLITDPAHTFAQFWHLALFNGSSSTNLIVFGSDLDPAA